MKPIELRKKSDEDLRKLLAEKRKALREFRFGVAGGKIRNTKQGRGLRKEIAQILTILKERAKVIKAS